MRSSDRWTAERWSDGDDIDLVAEMSAMTLDGAGAALFGSVATSSGAARGLTGMRRFISIAQYRTKAMNRRSVALS